MAGGFTLAAGEQQDIPFAVPVPWETPVTHVDGQRLRGMTMGLRTELAVAKAVDKGDLDEVAVHPLPAQEQILEAFDRARFPLPPRRPGTRRHLRRTPGAAVLPGDRVLPAAPVRAAAIDEVEVTFVTDPPASR